MRLVSCISSENGNKTNAGEMKHVLHKNKFAFDGNMIQLTSTGLISVIPLILNLYYSDWDGFESPFSEN